MPLKDYPIHELLSEILRREGINAREYTKAVGNLVDVYETNITAIECPKEFNEAFDQLIRVLEDVS